MDSEEAIRLSSLVPPLRALARERLAQEIALAIIRGSNGETPTAKQIKDALLAIEQALQPDA